MGGLDLESVCRICGEFLKNGIFFHRWFGENEANEIDKSIVHLV